MPYFTNRTGYPNPAFIWRKLDSNTPYGETTNTLSFAQAKLENNGNYSCTPRNSMGNGGAGTLAVDVHGESVGVVYTQMFELFQ